MSERTQITPQSSMFAFLRRRRIKRREAEPVAVAVARIPSHSSHDLPHYIQIDRLTFRVNAHTLTGAQLRALPIPAVREDYDLWHHGGATMPDALVTPGLVVPMRGARFYTAPRFINAG